MNAAVQLNTTARIFVSAFRPTESPGLPWLGTSSIWAVFVEFFRATQEHLSARMALTLYRQSIVNMIPGFENRHETFPQSLTFAGAHECFSIANHDQRISSSGQQDVESFWRRHESNISTRIASRQRDYDDIAFFSLVVVYNKLIVLEKSWGMMQILIICTPIRCEKQATCKVECNGGTFVYQNKKGLPNEGLLPIVEIRIRGLFMSAEAAGISPARTKSYESRSFRTGSLSFPSSSNRRRSWPR